MECIVTDCVRDAVNGMCAKHQDAHTNIEKYFPKWKEAYGTRYTYKKYLTRLSEDAEIGSGDWVMEVAAYLLTQNL